MTTRSGFDAGRRPAIRLSAVLLGAVLVAGLAALPAAAQGMADGARDGAAPGGIAEAGAALTFGIAAFNRGDYEAAAGHFEHATEVDPGNGDAFHWLGLADLALGRPAAAVEALEGALAAERPPSAGRERVRADLARARRAAAGEAVVAAAPGGGLLLFGAVPRWELRLAADYGDDSNPLRIADGLTVALPDGRTETGPQSDGVGRLQIAGDLRPWAGGAWTLALTGAAEVTRWNDDDFLDSRRLSAGADLAWGGDPAGYLGGPLGYARVPFGRRPLSLLLQARYVDDTLDGDAFRSAFELAAAATVREGAAAATVVSGGWSEADYDRDGSGPQERSGSEVSAAVDQVFYRGRRDRFLSLGATWRQRDAGAAFDAAATGGRATVALPFGRRWALRLDGAREEVRYDDLASNPVFLGDREREDTLSRFAASLSWAARDRLLFHVAAGWSERDTTLGDAADALFDLDYERTVVSAGVRWYLLPGGGR